MSAVETLKSFIDTLRELVEDIDESGLEASKLRIEVDKLRVELAAKKIQLEVAIKRIGELESGNPPPPLPPPPGPELKLRWQDDFSVTPKDVREGGPYLIDAQPGSLVIIQEVSPKIGTVLRVRCHAKGPLDANGTRRRCEIGLPDPRYPKSRIYRRDDFGKKFRYTVSVMFPHQVFEDNGKVVCWQNHGGHADPGDKGGRNPPLSLEFWGSPRRLRIVQAAFEVTSRTVLWELDNPDPTRWYRFEVSATWSAKKDGLLRILLDGAVIISRVGQNAFDDKDAFTFFRCGVYWPNATERAEDYKAEHFREALFKDLRIESVS